ncbi:MAG: S1C family serine protease [Patescibacteria group bacterium]|nr:S1C family serine protease [Patescibacteria group bacterium]
MIKNKIIIILLIIALGIFSGALGSLFARIYLFESLLEVPLFGDIDFSQNPLERPDVIISGARNVVVTQDTKAYDALSAVESNIVGIYKKKASSSKITKLDTKINLDNWYDIDETLGQGFIITSDGWLVSSFSPLEAINRRARNFASTSVDKIAQNYVIINSNKKVLLVDKIIYDPISQVSFYHIISENLPVKNFINLESARSGQLVLAANLKKQAWLTTMLGHESRIKNKIKSSDFYQNLYILEQAPPESFYGSFLFALDNSLMAIINNQGEVLPIDNFLPCLNCLLDNNFIVRPSLGLSYVDLSNYTKIGLAESKFGALITVGLGKKAIQTGSPADVYGLEIGDIILAVNNVELKDGKNLSAEINNKLPGDELSFFIERGDKNIEIEIILDELK